MVSSGEFPRAPETHGHEHVQPVLTCTAFLVILMVGSISAAGNGTVSTMALMVVLTLLAGGPTGLLPVLRPARRAADDVVRAVTRSQR